MDIKISQEAHKALIIASDEEHPVSNLEQLGVNQRMINILQLNNINQMDQLLQKKPEDLLSLNNFGQRQLKILLEALSKYNLIDDFN